MSQNEKLEYRILAKTPVPNDITPKELRALASMKGWRVEETGGSHTKFYIQNNAGEIIMYPVPLGGRKHINPVYIKGIRNIVES